MEHNNTLLFWHYNFRCWNIWPPLRLLFRKERLSHSGLCPKHHLRLLNSPVPKLLDLRPPPPPHRLQQRWRRPHCLRPCHRTNRPNQTWYSGYVHLLLLLRWHCTSLRHRLHLPNMALSIHSFLHPLLPLHHPCPSLYLRVSKMVPHSWQSYRSHETHVHHCFFQW